MPDQPNALPPLDVPAEVVEYAVYVYTMRGLPIMHLFNSEGEARYLKQTKLRSGPVIKRTITQEILP